MAQALRSLRRVRCADIARSDSWPARFTPQDVSLRLMAPGMYGGLRMLGCLAAMSRGDIP